MSDIQKYKPEFIFKFKNEIILTDKMKKKFIIITKHMKSSTDSKSFKVKISQDIKLNTNKWHRKRFMNDIEKTKKKINGNINMYSKLNYENIADNILKLKITSEEQIDFLINMIVEKYRLEHHSDVWNYLLKKIIFSNINKWKFNNKYIVEKILNIVQIDFDNIIKNYQEKLEEDFNNNIEEFYINKNKSYGLMKIISELFNYGLIDKEIITYILENLTLDINKHYKLELGIILVQNLFKYISLNEKNKFIDYFKLFLNNKSLNIKVKFMIYDLLEDKTENKTKNKVIVKNNEILNDDQIDSYIKSNIADYKSDSNIEDFLDKIKTIKIPVKSNKLIYFWIIYILENENDFDIAMLLLSSCIYKKIVKFNTLKYGLIEFLNDYDDYKWDYPQIDKIIKQIIKVCKKNGFLTTDNLKFIFGKVNIDIKSKFI